MRFIAAGLLLAASLAQAGVPVTSEQLLPSGDGSLYSTFPDGDGPGVPTTDCDVPAGWDCLSLGDGGGAIVKDTDTEWSFDVVGTSSIQKQRLAYIDGGTASTAEVQLIVKIDASLYSGNLDASTSLGIGLREGLTDTDFFHQCFVPISDEASVMSNSGTTVALGITKTAGAPGQSQPRWIGVTYDPVPGLSKCHEAPDDGGSPGTWTEVNTVARNYTDVKVVVFGNSRSETAAMQGSVTDIDLATGTDAITIYDNDPPDPPDNPNDAPILGDIPNQSGAENISFLLDAAPYCSDPNNDTLTFTASNLTGTGVSMSSAGLMSGTWNSTAVSASPFNVTVTCTDEHGAQAQDTLQVTVTASTGDTFTIPTSGEAAGLSCSGTHCTFTCSAGIGCGPGDAIVFAGGSHTNRRYTLSNLRGTTSAPITVRNDTSSGSRARIITPAGRPRAGIMCDNCRNVIFDGLQGWSGQAGGQCGVADNNVTEYSGAGCGIYIDGATNGPAQDALLLQGERRFITIQGLLIVGDWEDPDDNDTANDSHAFNTNDNAGYCADDNGWDLPLAPNGPASGQGEWVEGITIRKTVMLNFEASHTYMGANTPVKCGNVVNNTLPQRDMLIEYNILENSGANGIHLKRVPGDDPLAAIIRFNRVRNIGGSDQVSSDGHNNRPISCYEASCTVYGNIVDGVYPDDPDGPGITCGTQHRPASWGTQVCHVYNNVVIDTEGDGLNALSPNSSGQTGTNSAMEIRYANNTVVNAAGGCIGISSNVEGGYVRNTLCAGSGGAQSIAVGAASSGGNAANTVGNWDFTNSGAGDYSLTVDSPARNAGISTSCPADDFLGVSRPQGSACDRGAYEYDE